MRPPWHHCACIAGLLAALSAGADNSGEFVAGPAYAKFRLTLSSGWREEAAGPFYFAQSAGAQEQWGLPPFFCRTRTPDVDWSEWEVFYPAVDYRRFGRESRLQIGVFLSFADGENEKENGVRHTTVFPFYFSQRSPDTNLNYTAVAPFYGHLKNRLFRDDIRFVMFPLYSETRKRDVVTDNYLYPVFDCRRGEGMTGWQVWPLAGVEHKVPSSRTNSLDEVEIVGGYDKFFSLWPFYFRNRLGVGTTNPVENFALVPFYGRNRSPSRDETSYGSPLGFNCIDDREKGYVEHDLLWPLFVWAHGAKTVTRYFPIYSQARHNGMESDFYAWPVYKFNRLQAPPLDRHRTRVLFALYSDTVERNTETHDFKRRVDFWPFYSYQRELDGNRQLHVLALLEPFLPNNRTILREYAPLWALWRSEKNARTGAASRSLLWNVYRQESGGPSKKTSLLFGLIQYQSTSDGGRWRVCHLNLGGKRARTAASKS